MPVLLRAGQQGGELAPQRRWRQHPPPPRVPELRAALAHIGQTPVTRLFKRVEQGPVEDEIADAVDRLARSGVGAIIAIELVTASRAIELRAPLTPSPDSTKVIRALRETVAGPGPDRYLSPELEAATTFVASGRVMSAIQ
mgnify:CR=1 FL=1